MRLAGPGGVHFGFDVQLLATYRGGDCSREPPSAAREFRREFPSPIVTGCAPPSTRRAVRVVSSSVSRPHGDRQAWPRRRCRVVTGAASSISRLSSRFETTRPSSRRLRCLDGVRDTVLILIEVLVPVCRPRLCTLLRGLVCVVRSFRSRARRGCNPQNPLAVLPCFWATRPPFATRAATIRCGWLLRARPRRFRPLVNK